MKLSPCSLGCQRKGDRFFDMVPRPAPWSSGSFSTSENNNFFFFFLYVNFIWQQPHYGNNRLDQCKSISQTPSAGKKGSQKSMGILLACAAGCLEVIPVMSRPHFLEMDCIMALGSWMRSVGHPGHPTRVRNSPLARRLWLPAWLCLSFSHAQHPQPVASPCLVSQCCLPSHCCHARDGFRGFLMPAVRPPRCAALLRDACTDIAMRRGLILPPDPRQQSQLASGDALHLAASYSLRVDRGGSLALRDSV